MRSGPAQPGGVKSKRLVLEIDRTADPIAGRVVDEGGSARPFVGWIGLGTALFALLDRFTDVPKEDTP
jgi:hypothetical protein